MENSGRFKKGHKETLEIKEKRLANAMVNLHKKKGYHGMYHTKFYNSWRSMTTRCKGTCGKDSKEKYKNKGIEVCEEWKKFINFYNDMFPSYVDGLTIDRIDNFKGYFKENCKWSTHREQANNKRNTIYFDIFGEKLRFRDIEAKYNINYRGMRWRYNVTFGSNKELFVKDTEKRIMSLLPDKGTIEIK